MPTDTERLDFLQRITEGYGLGWILRRSTTGRGMRLHETSQTGACLEIRDAIDEGMKREFAASSRTNEEK